MKKSLRIAVLLVCAVLLLPLCVCAEDEDPVLMTVNGTEIRKSEADEYMYGYYVNGYIGYYGDYTSVLGYLAENILLLQKLGDTEYYHFTEEEEEAFRTEARDEAESYIQEYVEYYLSEDTEEARRALEEQAKDYYAGYEDILFGELIDNEAISRWYDSLDYEAVQESDVENEYRAYAAADEMSFKDNIYEYEYYRYMGYDICYTPAGYRAVQRLLITADEALLDVWTECQNEYDGLDDDASPEERARVTEKRSSAEQAVLDSVKDKTDAVYALLESGESFENVMLLYGEDANMADETMRREGYQVHRESILQDPSMIAAAFSEAMAAPGSVSRPYADAEGVSILYYLRDVPEGARELTDEMRAEIRDVLEDNRHYDAYTEIMEQWKQDAEIVYNTEAIEKAESEYLDE